VTRREREEVRRAILELMSEDGGFENAIGRLCRLVGWRYPAAEVAIEGRSFLELMQEQDDGKRR